MTDLEHQLTAAGSQPQQFAVPAGEGDTPGRMDENLLAIHAELDAPHEPWLARVLRRLGVPDLSVPLVTATPSLRRSWFVAIAIAVLFSLSIATNDTATGADRIVVFLTLAPLLPLFGVALAFGKGVDPTHDLVLAAPRDTFTVFLVRAITVLTASSLLLLVASLLLPEGGLYRVAWLLPALAIAASTLALSAHHDARRVAGALGGAWVVVVLVVTGAASAPAMFGPVTQVISLAVAVAASVMLILRRSRFDTAAVDA
jgi:membrane-associated HD superfamily phosphohydrolase